MKRVQQALALSLSALCIAPAGWGQQPDLGPQPKSEYLAYRAPLIPAARLGNSGRIKGLILSGKLYLTAQDAIALVLENNVDIENDRYNALISSWNYERQLAGGPLPGVPSGSSQVGSVQSGQGVAGSQAAAGVSNSGSNGGSGASTNATISQIGPITPTLDPSFQSSEIFSHTSSPQPNGTQTQISNLIDNTRNYTETLNAGFLTGTKASLSYSDSYLKENALTDVLNPDTGTALSISVQQWLLNGFGRALNARNITIAKANIGINDLTFKTQIITIVASVLNAYYALVSDYQDLKAKREALSVAQRFFDDNKKQVQIGTMAPLDVTTAEAQVASSQQDLVVSETTLEQDQVAFKNLISRNGLADKDLANVEVIPVDRIDVPEQENLPPFKDALATAMINRVDLEINRLNLMNTKTSNLGTANGVLPLLVALLTAKNQGLSGVPHPVFVGAIPANQPFVVPTGLVACPSSFGPRSICEVPTPYFEGGIGTALGQMIRRDFPSESGGAYFGPTLRNRQATADQAIDVLSLRQVEIENERTLNQVAVDVSNTLIGLQQARIRYLAAVKNRILEEQLLTAEQKKFALGASTTFNVVTQQRDLATAHATESASLNAYSQARVAFDQILGTTLKTNNISIDEAVSGRVGRPSILPAQPSMDR